MEIQKYLTSSRAIVYSLMALAFSIALHKKMIVPLVVIFFLHVILQFKFKTFISNLLSNKTLILLFLYYIMVAVSLLWTENLQDGYFDLEVKLSFIVFPVCMMMIPFRLSRKDIQQILTAFIIGVFLAVFICLVYATIRYINEPVFYYTFISSSLSALHHPTYFAMFINLAIIILLVSHQQNNNHSFVTFFSILILLFFNWLLMSRSGLVTSVLIVFLYWVSLILQRKFKGAAVLFAVFLIAAVFSLKYASYTMSRMSTLFPILNDLLNIQPENHSAEPQDARFVTWKAALQSIQNNPWTGTGAGDTHQDLNEYYNTHNQTEALEKQLNAHNQFLQTWMSVGIAGFLILSGMIILGFITMIRRRNIIATGFLLIILLTMITESILETQSGIVFFCFFYCLFMMQESQEEKSIEH